MDAKRIEAAILLEAKDGELFAFAGPAMRLVAPQAGLLS